MRVQIDLDTSSTINKNNVSEEDMMSYMIPQGDDLDESTRAQKIYDLSDKNSSSIIAKDSVLVEEIPLQSSSRKLLN